MNLKLRINENHLNAAGITHGGYLSALIDAGAGLTDCCYFIEHLEMQKY